MASIDLDAEYNNRARVPEHPEIFAQWERDAVDYRTKAMQERRAELGLAYGSTQRQFIDLFMPSPDAKAPLAMFVHGGYWRSLDPSMFSHAARGLNAHGVTVAVAGYDLCPEVSIAEIIEQIRHACLFLWLRTHQPIMVYGHSAGGHLAACLLATDWPAIVPNRVATPAPPHCSTMLLLCRKYSALSFSPTTASRLPRRGAFQNSGLAALAVAWSRRIALLIEVSTSGPRSNRPEMA